MTRFCTLKSGSKGNVALLSHNNTHLLIDAGAGIREVSKKLTAFGISIKDISAILVTHEHSDHIRGIRPLAVTNKIPVYVNVPTAVSVCSYCFECEHVVVAFNNQRTFVIGDIEICAFPTMHDAVSPVGYKFSFEGTSHKIGYATDTGMLSEEVKSSLEGCDFVFLESNHDVEMLKSGPYPYYLKRRVLSEKGHLSNEDCAAFLPRLAEQGTKSIMLAHLSQQNNTPLAAANCAIEALSQSGIRVGQDISLSVAPAFDTSCVITL